MTQLALKALLAPAFVVASSLLDRRFGPRVGGAVAGLPAIGGPILLVLALDRGRPFAAAAATGALLGVVGVMAFVLAYVAAARRFTWPVAVGCGWSAFALMVLALRPVHPGNAGALAIAGIATAGTLLVLPRRPAPAEAAPPRPRHDLVVRAACATVPVLVVTAAAGGLGSHLSGLLASFPVITPVLAAFTQAQRGADEATRLLRGIAAGFCSYALFCFAVAATLRPLGTAAAFALAIAAAALAQAVALVLTGAGEATAAEATV